MNLAFVASVLPQIYLEVKKKQQKRRMSRPNLRNLTKKSYNEDEPYNEDYPSKANDNSTKKEQNKMNSESFVNCGVCHFQTQKIPELKMHMKRKHSGNPLSVIQLASSSPIAKRPRSSCDECGFQSPTIRQIRLHKRLKHSSNTPGEHILTPGGTRLISKTSSDEKLDTETESPPPTPTTSASRVICPPHLQGGLGQLPKAEGVEVVADTDEDKEGETEKTENETKGVECVEIVADTDDDKEGETEKTENETEGVECVEIVADTDDDKEGETEKTENETEGVECVEIVADTDDDKEGETEKTENKTEGVECVENMANKFEGKEGPKDKTYKDLTDATNGVLADSTSSRIEEPVENSHEEGTDCSKNAIDPNDEWVSEMTGDLGEKLANMQVTLEGNFIACEQCKHTFKTDDELDTHMLNIHNNSPDIICDQCGKIFTVQEDLDTHILDKHGNEDTARPLDLSIKKTTENTINNKIDGGEKRPTSECNVCGSFIGEARSLQKNQELFHGKDSTSIEKEKNPEEPQAEVNKDGFVSLVEANEHHIDQATNSKSDEVTGTNISECCQGKNNEIENLKKQLETEKK